MTSPLRSYRDGDQAICERILRALPNWFGIESSLVQYVQDIREYPTWLAQMDDQVTGFITLREHNPRAAEIHVIAVHPDHHRRGIGRQMVEFARTHLRGRGFEFLQVKTLGPSRPDASYEKTRQFYEAMDFVPLEEFPKHWPGNPCLLMVSKL